MLELREFRDEMREDNRYVAEEIPKSQAEINEELYAFKSEFKEEFAQFRAQNDEQMADIRSKLDAIMDLLQEMRKSKGLEPLDMIGAPLDQVNSNPDGPTLEYSASTIVLGNPADEMLELNRALDLEENGDYDSIGEEITTKQSLGRLDLGDEASNMLDGLSNPIHKTSEEFPSSLQDGFRLVNETYQQPSLKLRSVGVAHHLFGDLHRHPSVEKNEGNHGNEIAGVLAQVIRTSISDALLTHIYFQKNQTWIIMKYGLISANLYSSRENLTYPAFVEFKNASFSTDIDVRFYFDPGGISVTCFSRGALHPLISKAPGICVNGMIRVVSSLMHAISVMASRDIHYLVGSIYFYLFSNGIHAIVAVIVDIGTHEDDFTKMDSKAMFEGVNFKLSMESILAYLAHSELVLLYPFEGLFIDNKVICIPTTYITESLKNEYFDIFRGASKERMALPRMLFSTHLVKFAQLSSWSPESSILTAWSSFLSYIHNSVKIRMEQRGYYVNDCLVSNSHFNKAPMEHFDIICNNGVTGWSSVEPHATFCSSILKNGGSEELCVEAIDETIENSVKLFLYFFDTDFYAYLNWKKLARLLLFDTSEVDAPEVHIMTESQQKCDDQFVIKREGVVMSSGCSNSSPLTYCLMYLKLVHLTVNHFILESLLENGPNGIVSEIEFSKEQSAQWPMLLQAFASRYGIPFSVPLSGIESHYHDKSVHLRELDWKVDKNVCTKFVLRDFIVTSLENLHTFMCDICKDEVVPVNFEWEFHQLSDWSWAIKNDLSFVKGYIVRKLKVHDVVDELAGDAMLILEYFGGYKHGRYSVRSKLGWGQFSTVCLSWYTEAAECIAMEVKMGAQHYIKAVMEDGIILKQPVIWEQDRNCLVKFLDHLTHEDILLLFMTDPSKVSRKSGVLVLLVYLAVAMRIFLLVISKGFVWDPGLVWVCHFPTLRTRRLLRGRICHVPRLILERRQKNALVPIKYKLLAVSDVICVVITLCLFSIIRVFCLISQVVKGYII